MSCAAGPRSGWRTRLDLLRPGLHERAPALLKDSAAKLPCNTMIQYHLGMVSAQLGDKEAARQALAAAAASPTPFPGQDEAKKAFAALK